MTREADALIIGAGPAGLSAGIVFASHGLRTVICEQKKLPVDKACGEGVMPTGLDHLKRLGVLKFLSSGEYVPFRGIRYVSQSSLSAEGGFQEGPGWGIPRLALSKAFNKRAEEFQNLEIFERTRAEPELSNENRIAVRVGNELFFTRLLIGADGINSRVRRWAGLEGPTAGLQRWGVRQHFTMSPWSDYVEIHWGKGIEAYITPCGKQQVSLTFLWDRHRYRNVEGGKRLLPSLLAAFPKLEEKFARAAPYDMPKTIGPMHRAAISPVGDGVILIGDAAGYLDALTGEGISLAAAQALALEKHIIPLFDTYSGAAALFSRRQLEPYHREYRKIVRPYYRMTRLALTLNRYPRLAEWTIRIFAVQPRLFQRVLSANMGSYHSIAG